MSSNSIRSQCPHCGNNAPQAFLPTVSQHQPVLVANAFHQHVKAEQRLVCTACEQTWEAAIVPKAHLEQLMNAVAGLDDARRQIAMMRLIMSKDQVARTEKSREEVIKLRRAA